MGTNSIRKMARAAGSAPAALALAFIVSSSACMTDGEDVLESDDPAQHEDISEDIEDIGEDLGDTGEGGDTLALAAAITPTFRVTLTPQTGITGVQRVNFAVPLPPGRVTNPATIRVGAGSANTELSAARRVLARYADGSARSVQLQVDVNVGTIRDLGVQIGAATAMPALTLASVATTLVSDSAGPKVWVVLPATWLAASGVVGPVRPLSEYTGSALDAWRNVCNYDQFNADQFIAQKATAGSWLYDRATAMFRGYAITGQLSPLRSGWREASIYRAGTPISGGVATTIPVPGASSDVKYHYAQGMAIHYLLTGDDRFREGAEAVAARMRTLFPNPGYGGGTGFWTERHAGFALLAYEWAAMVSDDRAATFAGYAQTAVDAYISGQTRFPANYTDAGARCFAHEATAHGEDYGYFGCSPWMSAILADGLDAHARRVGGSRATAVQQSIVKLGRILAREGRDATGRPLYWMGVGTTQDEVDEYDEHWGETAYVVAMAWQMSGRSDATLRRAADQLVAGLKTRGEAGQLRSFNWQCRSAVATPFFLK